jgi:hypothetical protein
VGLLSTWRTINAGARAARAAREQGDLAALATQIREAHGRRAHGDLLVLLVREAHGIVDEGVPQAVAAIALDPAVRNEPRRKAILALGTMPSGPAREALRQLAEDPAAGRLGGVARRQLDELRERARGA